MKKLPASIPGGPAATNRESAASSEPENDVQMTFFEHLRELRKRLILAVVAIVPAVGAAWFVRKEAIEILTRPYVTAWKQLKLSTAPTLHFARPMDQIVAEIQVSLLIGVTLASPWVFWQLWSFVSPGLYKREKRLAVPFVLASSIFLVAGGYAGYSLLSMGFEILLGGAGLLPGSELTVQPTVMLGDYIDFCVQMFMAFGLVAEVPLVLTFLAMAGIVTYKQLLKGARWWIVGSAVVAAAITPPDVVMLLVVFIPLVFLYFVSVGIAFVVGKRDTDPAVET